jgi:hypothetical protein
LWVYLNIKLFAVSMKLLSNSENLYLNPSSKYNLI